LAHSYCILGDGCNMEGISNEACSLAGHWGLGKLIALYDDNKISIDGHTEISFTEDVSARFEALGWHVLHVQDGNTDFDALRKVGGCGQHMAPGGGGGGVNWPCGGPEAWGGGPSTMPPTAQVQAAGCGEVGRPLGHGSR
jgi:hypothetical protein